jgi:DNA (cytosine-5)-methyltransferase 1
VLIGSLFSGIGGLELGLERALGWSVAWQVEQDEWCRRVLVRHWPGAERFDDVRTVGATQLARVDLICGGFPCQDVSGAGLGRGIVEGTRSGLWIEFDRIVGELAPRWVVVENVASGQAKWLPRVRHDLQTRGYITDAFAISAADVGAPHLRRRVFVVAHTDRAALRQRSERLPARWSQDVCEAEVSQPVNAGEALADPDGDGRKRLKTQGLHADGTSRRDVDGRHRFPPRRGDAEGWEAWTGPQPGICRGPDGVSRRMDRARLKALGNAVVPQCAEAIGRVIAELIRIEAQQQHLFKAVS